VNEPARVLVAGVGNVLRGDDGFGLAVVAALEVRGLPAGVRAVEVGINGISLVHELMEGWEALIVIDAVDRGAPPGTLWVLEPELGPPGGPAGRFDASDMHEMVPGRILTLARALGILPPFVRMVGCQPADTETFSLQLSPPVQAGLARAVGEVRRLVEGLLASAPRPSSANE
jgi:hydrogenase maturation protease